MQVRTRIAPSPTGSVHIGTIHNALFAHALAKSQGGDFILRVEDTDRKRYVEGSVEELYEILDVFNLTPDEGPLQGGKYGPYIQSEKVNANVYMKAALKLVEQGNAYYCFLSEEELRDLKGGQVSKKKGGFRSPYRDLPPEEARKRIDKGEQYVIRLKVPASETIEVDDAILGKVKWNSHDIDDQVLIKSDGFPTYQLAVVVDDHDMKISHVTRAFEWLPSTPKQVLLYKYLDYDMPIFAHSSLILDPSGGKLSKRKGTVAAKKFLQEGFLPGAIMNFLMLLGWAPPIERKHGEKEREIFSHEEFIKLYKLEDRQTHSAIFDRNKLIWFNQQYIKSTDNNELAKLFVTWMEKYAEDKSLLNVIKQDLQSGSFARKLELVKERAATYVEISEMLRFFYEKPQSIDLDIKQLKNVKPELEKIVSEIYDLLSSYDQKPIEWENEKWVRDMKAISEKHGLKVGDSFMVLRVALVGGPFSPPLFEAMQIMEKDEILARLEDLKS